MEFKFDKMNKKNNIFEFKDNKIIYVVDNNTYICEIKDKLHFNLIKSTSNDISNIIFNDANQQYYEDKIIKFKILFDEDVNELSYKFIYQLKTETFTKGLYEYKKIILPMDRLPYELTDDMLSYFIPHNKINFGTDYYPEKNILRDYCQTLDNKFDNYSINYRFISYVKQKVKLNIKNKNEITINNKEYCGLKSLNNKGDIALHHALYKFKIIHNGDSLIIIYPIV